MNDFKLKKKIQCIKTPVIIDTGVKKNKTKTKTTKWHIQDNETRSQNIFVENNMTDKEYACQAVV